VTQTRHCPELALAMPAPKVRPMTRLLATLLALGVIVAAGCRPPEKKPATTITSLHMSGMYAEAARAMARDFEKETGIHVQVEAAPYLTLREKEVTDLINGTAHFDVVQVAQQWDGEILRWLLPLEPLKVTDRVGLDGFIPSIRRNVGQWNGQTMAIPISADVITLLYRKDIFEARAREFEEQNGRPLAIPRTWPEYLELARFFHSDTLNGNIIMGLKEQNFGVWSGIFFGMGGKLLTPDWQPAFNTDTGVKSLEIFLEMFKYAPRESARLGIDEANALFLQGKGALYLTRPTLLWAQLQDTNLCKISGKIGAALIPGNRPQMSSWSLGINKNSREQDAAARWILFFSNAMNTKRMLLTYGKGSPRAATYEDEECRKQVFFVPQVYEGMKQGIVRPNLPESQELCDYLELQIAEAVSGRISARDALDQAASRWKSILKKAGYGK
jgi:ABC-type glycerol-3-phosphate transport system substrate-binding protein